MLAKKRLKRSQNNWNLILGVTPAHGEGQLATEVMRSQVPYEILSVNCVVEILDKVFKLAYILDAVTSSGILKAKQKLGETFNFDKQDVLDLTKFSKMTMCRASEANSEK